MCPEILCPRIKTQSEWKRYLKLISIENSDSIEILQWKFRILLEAIDQTIPVRR